jgi:hypothetical protein
VWAVLLSFQKLLLWQIATFGMNTLRHGSYKSSAQGYRLKKITKDRSSGTVRISAAFLLVFFFALLVAPFITGDEVAGAVLPACCRAHGAHHCSMKLNPSGTVAQGNEEPSFQTISAKCPYSPTTPVTTHTNTLRPNLQEFLFAKVLVYRAGPMQNEVLGIIAFDRARQERGPPALFLSV